MAIMVSVDKIEKAKAPVLQKDGQTLICYAHGDKGYALNPGDTAQIPLGFSMDYMNGRPFFFAHPAITEQGLIVLAGPTMLGKNTPLTVTVFAMKAVDIKPGDPVALLMLLDPAMMFVKQPK
jgi:hypothetical protein